MEGAPAGAPVTLIVAPAGYGKTTLLQALQSAYDAGGYRVAWLNCDERDGNPRIFGDSIAQALKHAGVAPRLALRRLEDLARRMTGVGESLALLIDEFELAACEANDLALERVARAAPENLRLIVAARSLPRRNFVRLELDGCLRLIDAASLRFTDAEARAFLDPAGPRESTGELIARAEGWPFALQLARLYSRRAPPDGHADPTPALPESRVAEYLANEVMSQFDASVRDFAIETSLLPVITVDDAIGATGRDDAAALLHQLEALSPIVTLERNPLRARFHSLFREYLRNELEKGGRAKVVQLHERVASMYEATQRIYEAVQCALEGGLIDLAASILVRAGGVRYALTAGLTDARRALNLLPPSAIANRLRLRLMAVGTMVLQERDDDAPRELAAVEAELQEGRFDGQLDEAARVDLATSRSLVRYVETHHSLAEPEWKLLHEATERAAEESRDDPRLWIVPLVLEIVLLLRQGSLERAAPLIQSYVAVNERDGRFHTSPDAWTHQANYELARGRLDEAEALAVRAAATLMGREGQQEGQPAQSAHAALGLIRYTRGDIEGALASFDRIRDDHSYAVFEVYAAKYPWRAMCDVALGNVETALRRLERASSQAASRNLVHLAVLSDAIRRDLRASHSFESEDEAALEPEVESHHLLEAALHSAELPWLTRTWLVRSEITTLIARERYRDAIGIAEAFIQAASGSSRRLLEAEAWLLLARASGSTEASTRARQAVARALSLTAGTGACRMFFDAGGGVLTFVGEWAASGAGAVSDWAQQIADRMTPADRLSWRQRAVLRELCRGYSNKEIARALRLSPETVKWHLKGIFDHFGLSTREAVISAATRSVASVSPRPG